MTIAFFATSIEDLEEHHIRELLDGNLQEQKTLDYKQELKIGSDSDKKEFLADVVLEHAQVFDELLESDPLVVNEGLRCSDAQGPRSNATGVLGRVSN